MTSWMHRRPIEGRHLVLSVRLIKFFLNAIPPACLNILSYFFFLLSLFIRKYGQIYIYCMYGWGIFNIPYRLAGAGGKIYSKLFTRRCYTNIFVSGDNKNYKPTLLQHPCQNNQNLSRTSDLPSGWFVIGEIYHLHSRRNTILCTMKYIYFLFMIGLCDDLIVGLVGS